MIPALISRLFCREIYGDDPALPAYGDLSKNISLIFFASHGISEGPIRPNVPAAIEVGGIQVKDRPDLLPQNMAQFLSDASNGAILLSLGSNLRKDHLMPETVRKMFNVVSKLKQKVIWKWDDLKNTPGNSQNILYSKWLPQDDILAHPTIRLFITHAGKGGVTEPSTTAFRCWPSQSSEISPPMRMPWWSRASDCSKVCSPLRRSHSTRESRRSSRTRSTRTR